MTVKDKLWKTWQEAVAILFKEQSRRTYVGKDREKTSINIRQKSKYTDGIWTRETPPPPQKRSSIYNDLISRFSWQVNFKMRLTAFRIRIRGSSY
jgi:hypothetical protein